MMISIVTLLLCRRKSKLEVHHHLMKLWHILITINDSSVITISNITLCPNFLKAITFSPVLLIFHLLNLSLNDSMMVEALPTGWTRTTPRHLEKTTFCFKFPFNFFPNKFTTDLSVIDHSGRTTECVNVLG